MRIQKALLLLALLSTILPSWSQRGLKPEEDVSPLVTGQTYAIIIGISKYKAVPSLQYAHRDAQAFEILLRSAAGGSVPKENIELFLDENATRNNVADAISETARKAKPGDRVYFFFAGHGDMEDLTQIENGLLLLHNSPNGNYFGMKDDVLELLDLKRYLSPLAQRNIEMIFIVDACHSGNLKGGVEGLQLTTQALATAWGKEYKILSCQPNQLSQEGSQWGGGRGLFALQLEEGIKGLADRNGDNSISFAEVQQYILEKVSTFSEYKQIPLVVGDLSKPLLRVDTATLRQLKKDKENERLTLGKVNTKGSENQFADSLPSLGKELYASFQKNVHLQQLIWPRDTNALRDYRRFTQSFPQHYLGTTMRRNLAAALNQRFDSIVNPMLRGETSYSNKDDCYYAGMELDSCLALLGKEHYMFQNLKARSLFMKAMSLTWALNENEYNVWMLKTVEKAINYMEESESLEPNAAYTIGQLGIHYALIGDYKKANAKFEKYLALRPNDFWAKQSLADIYKGLGQFEKAEWLYRSLIQEYPSYASPYRNLSEVLYEQGKKAASRDVLQPLLSQGYDTANYYFIMGLWATQAGYIDSSIYWYQRCYAYDSRLEYICLNNIGHKLMERRSFDSATVSFKRAIELDSLSPFPFFNLGCISMLQEDYGTAIDWWITSIEKNTSNPDGYLSSMSLYYGKKYRDASSKAFKNFDKKMRIFKLEYLSYLNILYIYLRVPAMLTMKENIDMIFQQLYRFKQHDAITGYHYACYQALLGNPTNALSTLEEALKKGFADEFALRNDTDLESIQKLPAFEKLMRQFFGKK